MEKPEFSKHFNIDHARSGAPYSCANGSRAEMLRFYASKMVGIHDGAGAEPYAGEWLLDGTYCTPGHGGALDLVMLPLGLIDGKPVFVGDEFIHRDGETITAAPMDAKIGFDGARWPSPTKAYPITSMTFDELAIVHNAQMDSTPNEFARSVRAIANAALRHAVDAGQVVPKGEHEATLHRLGDQLKDITLGDRAARDMAIAEAVRAAAVSQFDAAVNCLAFLKATHVAKQIGEIDLSAIIAGVIGYATPKT